MFTNIGIVREGGLSSGEKEVSILQAVALQQSVLVFNQFK